jgi:hypothetical protein
MRRWRLSMQQRAEIDREAREIVDREVRRLRSLTYDQLTRYLKPAAFEVQAPSGRTFQVEIYAHWDDKEGGDLRVLVAVDDSFGSSIFDYKRDGFIIAPDGSFIGES